LNEVGQRALDEARTLASRRSSSVAPEIDRLAAAFCSRPEQMRRLPKSTCVLPWRPHMTAGRWLSNCAAADLRRLELANGRPSDASSIPKSALEKFTEGHNLPDLRDAIELLR
jgi:hypothetical protein